MATWQFDLYFVPRDASLPLRTDEGYDVQPLVTSTALEAHSFLTKHFGQPWPMLEGWLVFGEESGSRFDLVSNEDGSSELKARIDARGNSESFCNIACELAQLLHCLLFIVESSLPLEPNPAKLISALNNSRASKFVSNPREFLRGVSNVG